MATSVSAETGDSRIYELTPVLSDRWRFTWRHLVVCAFFGSLFMILGHLPRTTSRMWLDLNEGRQIAEAGWIPTADTALPMSEGMPVVFSSWLSHLLAFQTQSWGGIEAVPQLFAAAVWIYVLVLACVFYAQSPRWQAVLIAATLVLSLDATGRAACGPHAWGAVCFALLLGFLTCFRAPGFSSMASTKGRSRQNRSVRHAAVAIALLFVLWANLHLSFLVGLAVLASVVVGRCYQVAVRTRSFRAVFADRRLRQWVLLTELAAAATLLNPYGTGIYFEAIRVLTNETLHATPVWDALSLRSWSGVMLVVTAGLLALVLRYSRRRVHPVHVILLVLSTGGMILSGFGVRWFAPIAAFILARHLYDAMPADISPALEAWGERMVARIQAAGRAAAEMAGLPPNAEVNSNPQKGPFTFIFTLLCAVTLWTTFVYSPIGHATLGGGDKLEVSETDMPLAACDFLGNNAEQGLIYAPVNWSDWLLWNTGTKTAVLLNSNVHRVPKCVLDDHNFVAKGAGAWERPLDNYQVSLLVVDKSTQSTLAQATRDSEAWEVVFEDETALVARRTPGGKRESHKSEQPDLG